MSLPRDSHPGIKIDSIPFDEGSTKIKGKLAVGYKDGKFFDQKSPNYDQGYGALRFDLSRMEAGKEETSSLNMRLEPERIHKIPNDLGINFAYSDSKLGTINAYTYKEKSLMSAIKYLAEFVNDPNNSQHILYGYISQISSILNMIAGSQPLAMKDSKEEVKKTVLDNLSKLDQYIDFTSNEKFQEILNNYTTNPNAFHSLENTIRITLNLSSINNLFTDPFDVVIDFNGTSTSLINIRIENLKLGSKFGFFDIGIIDAYNGVEVDESKIIIKDLTLNIHNLAEDHYIDLSDLPILLKVGINTTKSMEYHFTGYLKIPLVGTYNLDFYIEISDKVNPNTNMLYVKAYIKVYYPKKLSGFKYYQYFTELFLEENMIYIRKTIYQLGFGGSHNGNKVEYFKCTQDQFLADLPYYLAKYIMDNDMIYDQMIKDQSTSAVKPFDFIKSFNNIKDVNATTSQFVLNVQGKLPFLSISMFGPINIEYNKNTFMISGIYAKIAVISNLTAVELDIDMKDNSNKEAYINDYDSIINLFKTGSLSYLGNRLDHNDMTNIKIVECAKDVFNPMGESIMLPR